jgi:hypothetical protein
VIPFAAVNQTLLVVSAEVPTASLFPVVHAAGSPGPSLAVSAAWDSTGADATSATAAIRRSPDPQRCAA